MKRFERSNGLDTALYKNFLYLLPLPYDSGEYGQTVGICRLETAFNHSTGFIQWLVQFHCMGGAFPHRAIILCT